MPRRRPLATPRATFTEWWWSPPPTVYRTVPAGYRNFEHILLPEVDPGPNAPYVWAHEFRFIGGGTGFVGLQGMGERADGSVGKTAVLWVWDAVRAEGPGAARVSGDNGGWSCQIPFEWVAGREYALRVWTEGDGSGRHRQSEQGWWSAAVRDEASGRTSFIGRIEVPGHWRRLSSSSVMWTQYQGGPLASCDDLPYSRVVFGAPTAEDGQVDPERSHDRLGEGTCAGSHIEAVEGGVRHEMGLPER